MSEQAPPHFRSSETQAAYDGCFAPPPQSISAKLDLCEGGCFSTAIFNGDIQVSVFSPVRVLYLACPFVALLKATYAEKNRTLFFD